MKNDVALLLLRITGLGLAFGHGLGKLTALAGGHGDRFIQGVANLGFPLPGLFAWAAALAEFGGGLFVALGLGTRFAAAFAAFTMTTAAFLRHKAHLHLLVKLGLMEASEEQMSQWGNPELALAYLFIMVALVFAGGGRYSLDRVLGRRR